MIQRLRNVALVAFFAYVLAMVTLPTAAFLAHTAPDDAFYYLAIARRFGEAPWPTFDGAHVTTGFHPLWLFVLLPLAKVIPDPMLLARVAVALGGLLSGLAAWGLGRWLARTLDDERAGDVGTLLLLSSAGFARFGLQAMETPLAMVLAVAFLFALERAEDHPIELGLAATAVVLARLDMAILVALGFGALVWRTRRLPIRAGLVSAGSFAPYALWNLSLTGHVSTSSSAVKAWVVAEDARVRFGGRFTLGFAREAAHAFGAGAGEVLRGLVGGLVAGPLAWIGGDYPSVVANRRALVIAILFTGGLVAAAVALTRIPDAVTRGRGAVRPLLVPVAAAGLHLFLSSVLLTGQAGPWYWGLAWLAVAIVVAWTFHRSTRAARPVLGLLTTQVVSLVLLTASLAVMRGRPSFLERRSFSGTLHAMRAQVASALIGDERVGGCNAGTLGLFGSVPIVNLDGLVNDAEYLEARRHGELRRYLREQHIALVADCVPRANQAAYARQLGLDPLEIQVVSREDARTCEAFVWRVRP